MNDSVTPDMAALDRRLRDPDRPWRSNARGKPVKKRTVWILGREFDVVEDDQGVVEIQRHRARH